MCMAQLTNWRVSPCRTAVFRLANLGTILAPEQLQKGGWICFLRGTYLETVLELAKAVTNGSLGKARKDN